MRLLTTHRRADRATARRSSRIARTRRSSSRSPSWRSLWSSAARIALDRRAAARRARIAAMITNGRGTAGCVGRGASVRRRRATSPRQATRSTRAVIEALDQRRCRHDITDRRRPATTRASCVAARTRRSPRISARSVAASIVSRSAPSAVSRDDYDRLASLAERIVAAVHRRRRRVTPGVEPAGGRSAPRKLLGLLGVLAVLAAILTPEARQQGGGFSSYSTAPGGVEHRLRACAANGLARATSRHSRGFDVDHADGAGGDRTRAAARPARSASSSRERAARRRSGVFLRRQRGDRGLARHRASLARPAADANE